MSRGRRPRSRAPGRDQQSGEVPSDDAPAQTFAGVFQMLPAGRFQFTSDQEAALSAMGLNVETIGRLVRVVERAASVCQYRGIRIEDCREAVESFRRAAQGFIRARVQLATALEAGHVHYEFVHPEPHDFAAVAADGDRWAATLTDQLGLGFPRKRRGQSYRDEAGDVLASGVALVLQSAGVNVTGSRDGPCARVLRVCLEALGATDGPNRDTVYERAGRLAKKARRSLTLRATLPPEAADMLDES